MSDIFSQVSNDIARAVQQPQQPINAGCFTAKIINDVMTEAKKRPDPRKMYGYLWYEGEVSCLFADSNLGKSILAVDIARGIAQRDTAAKVLYFDFELSDKQFQLRYTDEHGNLFRFPDNLLRVEINREALNSDFDKNLLADIENMITASGSRVVIIDNLTWMCGAAEKGEEAASLMQRLMSLKFKYDLSLLVIAHTPKRDMSRPITANDLAGSRKLFNFFDSVFAIGKSAKDEKIRYIKQIKVRHGEFTHGADNVIICEIVKEGAFTHFSMQGMAREAEHLKEQTDKDRSNLIAEVKRMSAEGKPYRAIASELGVSKSTAERMAKT